MSSNIIYGFTFICFTINVQKKKKTVHATHNNWLFGHLEPFWYKRGVGLTLSDRRVSKGQTVSFLIVHDCANDPKAN